MSLHWTVHGHFYRLAQWREARNNPKRSGHKDTIPTTVYWGGIKATYCSWPSSCHGEVPSGPWWWGQRLMAPPQSGATTKPMSVWRLDNLKSQNTDLGGLTAACLFWMVSFTVIRRPFQSPVAFAMSSPTFLGD